jgi:hypothetical protein
VSRLAIEFAQAGRMNEPTSNRDDDVMKALKIIFAVVGVLAFLMGLLWAGQGSGIVPYPATSPMINQSPWIWRGAGLAIVGLIVLWLSRRLRA